MFLGRDVGEVYAGGGQGVQSGLRFLLHNNIDVRILNIVKRVRPDPRSSLLLVLALTFLCDSKTFHP